MTGLGLVASILAEFFGGRKGGFWLQMVLFHFLFVPTAMRIPDFSGFWAVMDGLDQFRKIVP